MIYLEKSVIDFLEEFPFFKKDIPLCECNAILRPFINKTTIGLECACCHTALWVKRDSKENEELRELLL